MNLCTLDETKTWLDIAPDNSKADSALNRLIAATSSDFLREINRYDLTPAADYVDRRTTDGRDRINVRHFPLNAVTLVTVDDVAVDESPDGIADGWYIEEGLDPEDADYIIFIGDAKPKADKPIMVEYNAGYADIAIADEAWNVPAGPIFTITVLEAAKFASDSGVKYQAAGVALVKVGGAPAVGQYSVSTSGVYTFNAADAGVLVLISYKESGIPDNIRQAVVDWVAYRWRQRGMIGQTSKQMDQGGGVTSFQQVDMPPTTRAVADFYRRSTISFG